MCFLCALYVLCMWWDICNLHPRVTTWLLRVDVCVIHVEIVCNFCLNTHVSHMCSTHYLHVESMWLFRKGWADHYMYCHDALWADHYRYCRGVLCTAGYHNCWHHCQLWCVCMGHNKKLTPPPKKKNKKIRNWKLPTWLKNPIRKKQAPDFEQLFYRTLAGGGGGGERQFPPPLWALMVLYPRQCMPDF